MCCCGPIIGQLKAQNAAYLADFRKIHTALFGVEDETTADGIIGEIRRLQALTAKVEPQE